MWDRAVKFARWQHPEVRAERGFLCVASLGAVADDGDDDVVIIGVINKQK